jgi:hypothetical protein
MEEDSPRRAFEAFETGDTVLLPVLLRSLFRNRSHRTLLHAFLTFRAIVRHRPFENTQPGKDRKESSQRAKISAPEPLADDSERQNSDEKDEDEEIDLKDRQRDARYDEGILWKHVLNLRKQMIKDEDGRRIKGDDQGSCDQADGIENIHHLESHQPCNDREEKDPIAKSSERLIVKWFGPSLFPEEEAVEEVDDRTHGAEPSAEEVSKNDNKKKHSKRREYPFDEAFVCEC